MSKGNILRKMNPNDLSKDELIITLNWTRGIFQKRFPAFCKYYGFKITDFHQDGTGKYLIRSDWKDILIVLLKAFEYHPLAGGYKREIEFKHTTLHSITLYYEKLMEFIEELPKKIKYDIKDTTVYYRTLQEVEGLAAVQRKFTEVLTATSLVETSVRVHVWKELYDYLDYLIYRTYEVHQEVNEKAEILKAGIDGDFLFSQSMNEKWQNPWMDEQYKLDKLYKINRMNDIEINEERRLGNATLDELLVKELRSRMESPNQTHTENEDFQELIETREKWEEALSPTIKRITGYSTEQLKEMKNQTYTEKVDRKVKEIQKEFNDIQEIEEQVQEIIIMNVEEGNPKKQDFYNGFIGFLEDVRKQSKMFKEEAERIVAKSSYIKMNEVKERLKQRKKKND
ncbi:hypothetical protein [Neobacillus mesonae]|uniref:hypothetical protein n=1 Tax=Neobacillus mesonae TaxID=1193713 RepID=UPI00203AF741|nr:hypothetical protein [Neobacillus mesonae]MCM3567004.1 hypothetical protein [Neobacillus mesonae]